MQPITVKDITGLEPQEQVFVLEYTKDFNARRAARAAGYPASEGVNIREKPHVKAAIQVVLNRRIEMSEIDAEWILMEAVDNVLIAKQLGKISASNTALGLLAKLSSIDAFAADKIIVEGDEVITERMRRARDRMNNTEKHEKQPDDDKKLSFF